MLTKCRPVQLETAATAGVVVVLAVIGIVMYEAINAGLPGLASGDVPVWSLKVRRGRGPLTQQLHTIQVVPCCFTIGCFFFDRDNHGQYVHHNRASRHIHGPSAFKPYC